MHTTHTTTSHSLVRTMSARTVGAVVALMAVISFAVVPAGADESLASTMSTTTVPTTSSDRTPPPVTDAAGGGVRTGAAGAGAIPGRYMSLTATLMSQWAATTNADVDDLIGPNGEVLASALGSNVDTLRQMGVDGVLGDLDATVSSVTLGVDAAGFDFDRLATALPNAISTPDGASVAAGVMSAREMAQLDVPDLTSPGLLDQAAPLSSIGADSLAFGLFYNQSLTSLAQSSPDVLTSVLGPGGLGDPRASTAWGQARQSAAQRLSEGFGGDLLNPCLAVLFSSMASGSSEGNPTLSGTSDGCRPCAVAGAYMGDQMGQITSGDTPQRLIIGDDGVVTDYEWFQQGEGARELYYDSYPGLRSLVEDQERDAAREGVRQQDCADSQSGMRNFLSGQGGNILSRLGG
jgi:hypothetical protein